MFIFVFCCGSDFSLNLGNEIAESDEIFSSPITVPLYTNTVVETDNNDNNNDNTIESENKNDKLRPRYNIAPNLGNRIDLVSAQTAKSLPGQSPIKHAEFNTLKPNPTSAIPSANSATHNFSPFDSTLPTVNQPNIADNLTYDLAGKISSSDSIVTPNALAKNYQQNEIMPLDIPQEPNCNSNYSNSSYDKFIDKYAEYILGAENHRYLKQYNCGLFCNGWIEGGIFLNSNPPEDKRNPVLQYNDRDREFVMNQLYISFGRKLTYRRNWFELGGQIDLLYGTDYFYTSAVGLETRRSMYLGKGKNTIYPEEAAAHWNASHGKRRNNTAALYGLSLPQAYGEIRLPFSWDTTIKTGHFYANTGIESATAARNFFYTHSYNFMFGQPTTLTGILITSEVPAIYHSSKSRQTLIFGITQGWDMFDKQGGLNYIIGTQTISRHNEQNYISFIAQIGQQSESNSNSRISYTLAINRKLSDRLTDSLEHNFGYEKDGAVELGQFLQEQYRKSSWISVAKYLKYDITGNLSIGLRAEWFRDNGLARIQQITKNSPGFYFTGKNYYELTLGANWRPTPNITIRPELRFDWSDVRSHAHSNTIPNYDRYDGKSNMTSFAIDTLIRF